MPVWMKWFIALVIGVGIIVIGFRWWGPLLTIFYILNCLVLMIVVLLQSGKAADLAGAFGGAGSQTAFGPRGAATILSQATTWCAIMFMICAFALVLRVDKSVETGGSVLQQVSKPAPQKSPATTPVAPAPAQQTTPSQAPQPQTPQSQAPASQGNPPAAPSASQPAPATPKKP